MAVTDVTVMMLIKQLGSDANRVTHAVSIHCKGGWRGRTVKYRMGNVNSFFVAFFCLFFVFVLVFVFVFFATQVVCENSWGQGLNLHCTAATGAIAVRTREPYMLGYHRTPPKYP